MNYNGKRAQKHVLRRPREKELKIISKNPYIKKKSLLLSQYKIIRTNVYRIKWKYRWILDESPASIYPKIKFKI